jgi:hypothetical protein
MAQILSILGSELVAVQIRHRHNPIKTGGITSCVFSPRWDMPLLYAKRELQVCSCWIKGRGVGGMEDSLLAKCLGEKLPVVLPPCDDQEWRRAARFLSLHCPSHLHWQLVRC